MRLSANLAIQRECLIYGLALLLLLGFTFPSSGQSPEDAGEDPRFPAAGIAAEAPVPSFGGLTGTSTVERTEEGQRGTVPTLLQRAFRYQFLPLALQLDMIELPNFEEAIAGGALFLLAVVTDSLTPVPNPTELDSFGLSADTVAPAFHQDARSNLAAEGGTSVVAGFSYAEDGTQAGTMRVRLIAFDQDAVELFHVTVDDDLTTFPGDPFFSRTGLAVDNQGRSTVAYTELFMGTTPRVLARRVDVAGVVLDATPIVVNNAAIDPSAALLEPAGGRAVVVSTDFANIKGNVLDFTGATPAVGPQFQISTTPGQFLFLPSVASNPVSGEFLVVWEHLTGTPGNPQNIRARRFDGSGAPMGPDFQVNTLDANAQGQPAVAFGPRGESVVVWTGDAPELDGTLDVFFQAYDADGDPIGGEQRANSSLAGFQDRPVVNFLPTPDAQGNSRFAIYWRDVGNVSGSNPNGTGTSYGLFTIVAPRGPKIFADGFESGDTSSWSATVP